MRYISVTILVLAAGCNVTVNHSPTCDMSEKSHVCPELGHGPCPFCPPVEAPPGVVVSRLSPIPIEKYDEEILQANANRLDMRYVDYLHALTNNKISHLRATNALK